MKHTRSRFGTAAAVAAALALTACGGGSGFEGEGGESGAQSPATGPVSLDVLIASSGDAETAYVTQVAQAWATQTGNTVNVTAAQDMQQQLGQGFAAGSPPDVFYVDASRFADYASVGSLHAYGADFPEVDDFYENLRTSFTYEDELYCVPKDFSTLALQINTDLWAAAGLTDADVPTTWEQLQDVATTLTSGDTVGLAIGDTRDRIGAFMVQNGGWVLGDDGTSVTADSPENAEALEFVRGLLQAGVARYPAQLDSGWSGEAFGKQRAAMTIEGNWIKGALSADFPDVKYTVAPLPAGPAGPGTLSFTQCWGVAEASDAQTQAVDLVEALTTKDAQLGAAEAFGVMPSRESAQAEYTAAYPQDTPFIEGAEYAQGPVNAPKMDQVLAEFDTGLQTLPGADPQQILTALQTNASAALGQ